MTSLLARRGFKTARNLLAVGVVLMASHGTSPIAASAAEEPDLGGFQALAVASGQRITFTVTEFLVIQEFFDGPGPVAQSTLDGTSGGESFASMPYPGSTVLQYPAFVALATGETPPGYPFYVNANPGEPEETLSDPTGTYHLEAKASRESAQSIARLRGGADEAAAAGSVSTTSIVEENGKLVATAESVTDGLTIAGALRIGSVHSKSVTTYAPAEGPPKTVSTLVLDGGAVNDTRFSFGPEGLKVQEAGIPLPVGEGLAALNAALAPAGLSVRFLDPEPITGGAQAGTFEVTGTGQVPGGASAVLRVRLGQATTAVVPGGDALPPVAPEELTPGLDSSPPSDREADAAPVTSADVLGEDAALSSIPPVDGLTGSDFGFGSTGGVDPGLATGASDFFGAAPSSESESASAALGAEVTAPASAGVTSGEALPAGQVAAVGGIPSSVGGVYTAIAWATVGVLVFSVIWRQGARIWTS